MKLVAVIFVLISLTSAAPKVRPLKYRNLFKEPIKLVIFHGPRIIGGQEVAPHSIPWQTFLEIYSKTEGWYCGGSLISEKYVVTAAHCIDGAHQAYVTLEAHAILESEPSQLEKVSQAFIIHEKYDRATIENDIGVISLPENVVTSSSIKPVKLPSTEYNFTGEFGRASGWGLTDAEDNRVSEVLMYIDAKIIDNNECEETFGSLNDSVLCANANGGTICGGDAGGPLIFSDTLIGISSFGLQNCPTGYPIGFSRVSSFVTWLEANTDVSPD